MYALACLQLHQTTLTRRARSFFESQLASPATRLHVRTQVNREGVPAAEAPTLAALGADPAAAQADSAPKKDMTPRTRQRAEDAQAVAANETKKVSKPRKISAL